MCEEGVMCGAAVTRTGLRAETMQKVVTGERDHTRVNACSCDSVLPA